jgi:inosine-uridine nucleoside N-ribohydrolase
MVLHDPLAVALAIDPTLATWEPVRLVIGPDGQTRRAAGETNCRFARTVDAERFLAMFLERLCPAS